MTHINTSNIIEIILLTLEMPNSLYRSLRVYQLIITKKNGMFLSLDTQVLVK